MLLSPLGREGCKLLSVLLAVVRREGEVRALLVWVLRLERSHLVLVRREDVLRKVGVDRWLTRALGDLAALGELDRLAVLADQRLASRGRLARERI